MPFERMLNRLECSGLTQRKRLPYAGHDRDADREPTEQRRAEELVPHPTASLGHVAGRDGVHRLGHAVIIWRHRDTIRSQRARTASPSGKKPKVPRMVSRMGWYRLLSR